MYKLVASDVRGNILDVQHLMTKPSSTYVDRFFRDACNKFKRYAHVSVTKLKYIEMGLAK